MKYLICNLKNKLTYNEMKQYCNNLNNIAFSTINFIICPTLPYIYNFIDYTLGAQDISAYSEEEIITGEISGKQLKSLAIEYVIIGHPERREKLNENINILKEKIKQANANDIKVIYCFTEKEKDLDRAKQIITSEYEMLKDVLKSNALIAYEPKWAIGNEENLDYSYIKEIIEFIKSKTNNNIIYGGGVNSHNIEELLKINNINGFLLSNSALDYKELQIIIKKMT